MTPIANMVEQMLKFGVPPEMIVLAVRTAEESADIRRHPPDSPVDVAAEKRRAYDRERQREKREAEKSADSPPTSSENALSSSSLSDSPTSQEVDEKKVSKKEKRARGEKIPPEWRPPPEVYDYGKTLGLDRADIDATVGEMIGWGQANSHRAVARKTDWYAALQGWMRRKAQDKQRNSHENPNSVVAAADRLIERVRGFDDPAPSGIRSGAGPPALRLLQKG